MYYLLGQIDNHYGLAFTMELGIIYLRFLLHELLVIGQSTIQKNAGKLILASTILIHKLLFDVATLDNVAIIILLVREIVCKIFRQEDMELVLAITSVLFSFLLLETLLSCKQYFLDRQGA